MIDKESFQVHGDNLLQAWSALREADEHDDASNDTEAEASFGRFSEMVNTMMDKGLLGDVMDHLSERMESGEIMMPSDMVMDIIDSLSVCVKDKHYICQMVAVPLSGEARAVVRMAKSMDWSRALECLGIFEGECELVGVARDTEMSMLMLDVVAVGALTRGLSAESVHGVFLDENATGDFHGVALLRCRSHYTGSDRLGDVLVDDEQEGIAQWEQMLCDGGAITAHGPRLPREGVSTAAAERVVSTLERLRATEADQARPGIAAIMFGLDPECDLSPEDMCWMSAIYKDGSSTSIKCLPAPLAPITPVICGVIEMRYGIDASPVELSDMFASLATAEKHLGGPAGGATGRLH